MTVEQSPLPVRTAQRKREDDPSLVYAKVREVTGAPDSVIEEAIKACIRTDGTYKVEDVVTTIIADDTVLGSNKMKSRQTQVVPFKPSENTAVPGSSASEKPTAFGVKRTSASTSVPASQSGQQASNEDFIDLTRDTQGILGGQVSREEQDISRVLEQSLAESKGGTKRKRGELWFIDPLNPHERKRQEGWPVGLKNVGNTCWFSAVIQSLFHIGKFRQLVLAFKDDEAVPIEKRNLRFVSELKQVFGLLVGSARKYVDPSKAVDILKEDSATTVADGQQDVSEFQHKLLDWLEDAFSSSAQSPQPGVPTTCDNPIQRLFQGKYKAEGVHEGKVFHQEVTFGQYPLNVIGFRNIHESLEATMAQGEIETLSGDSGQKSGQEIWFTHLPVVLTFELSRFGFNPHLNQAEKIHQELEFPEVIFVDRYLECNKSCIRQKREEARKLREELSQLQARLDKFMNYGSSSKRYPLPDVLQCALEFAQSSPSTTCHPHDVDMESSSMPSFRQEMSSVSSQDVSMSSVNESPQTTPSKHLATSSTQPEPSPTDLQGVSASEPSLPSPSKNLKSAFLVPGQSSSLAGCQAAALPNPHPREVSESELRVLQDCLRRWRTEVESDVRELQTNISSLECKLGSLYSEKSMQKFPYHLHAVLVHEGQAVSGHYWAFIYDEKRSTWLKFNDITISHSSWKEMQKESVGGFHNASAYCLMYVDRSRLEQTQGSGDGPCVSGSCDTLESLPEKLRQAVEADNALFCQELSAWDEKERSKAAGTSSVATQESGSSPTAALSPMPPSTSTSTITPAIPPSHLKRNQAKARPYANDPDVQVTGEQRRGESVIIQPSMNPALARIPNYHAELSLQATLAAVQNAVDGMSQGCFTSVDVLEKAMDKEFHRLKGLSRGVPAKLPSEDLRLTHFVLYLMASGADSNTVKVALSEQFSFCPLLDSVYNGVRQGAQDQYSRLYSLSGDKGIRYYEFWHKRYSHFRQAVSRFVAGLEAYCQERYQEALPYFTQAWLHNCEPGLDVSTMGTGGINPSMLAYFRRQSLQKLNETTMKIFESDNDMTDALTIMTQQILPSLSHVVTSGLKEDVKTAEDIRAQWCQFLGKDLDSDKIERLQDFLSKMFDGTHVMNEEPGHVRANEMSVSLFDQYTRAMRKVKDIGELGRWMEAS